MTEMVGDAFGPQGHIYNINRVLYVLDLRDAAKTTTEDTNNEE